MPPQWVERADKDSLDRMDREIKEVLIGSAGTLLFGLAVVTWPSFGLFIDEHFFVYVRIAWGLIPRIF